MAKSAKTKAKRARKPVDSAKKAHRKRNAAARDQFAALGLFIQNFEHIVSTLREECRRIVMGGRYSGVTLTDNRTRLFRWNICSLAFHHEVMTARPLLDIWRALVFEECRALVAVSEMTKAGSAAAAEITKEIASHFKI